MQKLFYSMLSVNRKRRWLMVSFTLRLLRIVRSIEEDELNRYTDELEEFNSLFDSISGRSYDAVEADCSECEFVLGYLVSAIEDLEFAYGENF